MLNDRLFVRLVYLPIFLLFCSTSVQARDVVIAMVSDGPLVRELVSVSLIQKEIRDIVGDEFAVSFPQEFQLHGDWSTQGIRAQLDNVLVDDRVDIVITMGVVSTHIAAHIDQLPKPVIAPFVVDVDLQNIPYQDDTSGKDQFVYIRQVSSVADDLIRFRKLTQFQHLAILADQLPVDAIPNLTKTVDNAATELDFKISFITGTNELADYTQAIPADADAVFVAPLLRINNEEIVALAEYLIERKLPSFSLLGQQELDLGMMATVAGRASDQVVLARRIATNVYRILLGTPAKNLNVDFYETDRLSVNMRTARAIGISPKWIDLEDAQLLYENERPNAKTIELTEAMLRAVDANVDLQAVRIEELIAEDDVRNARAGLLPQLNASASYQSIDQDRANVQSQAENSADAGVELSQTLYADSRWANYTISKLLKSSIDLETKINLLDTLQLAANAYLNVLRTSALERVQKSNVEVTRENLDLAQARVQIGQSARADVLRWRSQLASDRRNLVNAESDRQSAEVELLRVLHLPHSEPILTTDDSIEFLLTSLERNESQELYDNPLAWENFQSSYAKLAVSNAPELARFDYLVDAQQRQVSSDRRAFYIPELTLTGDFTENLHRSGSGSNLSGTGIDDERWSVGVRATLPIFTSGLLRSQLSRSKNTYRQLLLQRQAQLERVETRMRSALFSAAATHASIRLSEQAQAAAVENLEIVTDSYSQGAVSITDLIDAQDASLEARLQAAAARYEFVIALVEVLRAESNFDLLLSKDGVSVWKQRIIQAGQ